MTDASGPAPALTKQLRFTISLAEPEGDGWRPADAFVVISLPLTFTDRLPVQDSNAHLGSVVKYQLRKLQMAEETVAARPPQPHPSLDHFSVTGGSSVEGE